MTKKKMGLPRPTKRHVLLSELTTDEATFQPRLGDIDERQVLKLCDALRRGVDLDPISVWENPENGEFVVADGHHRLEAHQRINPKVRVQVEVFRCDVRTAAIIPMIENTKERLNLPREDRAEWTWKRLSEGGWRVVDLYKLGGVSKRTVQYQKSTMKALEAAGEAVPSTWKGALATNSGERDHDAEHSYEALMAATDKADREFGSGLTELCKRRPEAAAELIKRCAGRMNLVYILRYLEKREKTPQEIEEDALPF